ncbi:MAG: ribosome-binding factor A [Proteobacteria bacterium]|nr:ribosome-binding factor A [Pseudomonadota bacterium]
MKKQRDNSSPKLRAAGNRGERIASAVQKHVAEILRDNYADDPVLSGVSLVGALSHGGLQFARLYYYVRNAPSCLPPLGGESARSAGGGATLNKIKNNNFSEEAPPRQASPDTPPQEGGDATEQISLTQHRLDAVKSQIRRELAARMNQRYVPDLQFVYDDTLERAARVEELLATADT